MFGHKSFGYWPLQWPARGMTCQVWSVLLQGVYQAGGLGEMQIFRVCTVGWSTSVSERTCVAMPVLHSRDMDMNLKLLTKVQKPLEHAYTYACTHVQKHMQTPRHGPCLTQHPLELPWTSVVSWCCCLWVLWNDNFFTVFKTKLFICFPVPTSAWQCGN